MSRELEALVAKYPQLIREMPPVFNSHQFILHLARNNQAGYVEALYAFRGRLHKGYPSPFKALHTRLAMELAKHPTLIKRDHVVQSTDIFGQGSRAVLWRRI